MDFRNLIQGFHERRDHFHEGVDTLFYGIGNLRYVRKSLGWDGKRVDHFLLSI